MRGTIVVEPNAESAQATFTLTLLRNTPSP
jgi:hypothetical protein